MEEQTGCHVANQPPRARVRRAWTVALWTPTREGEGNSGRPGHCGELEVLLPSGPATRPGPGSFSNSTWIRSVDHCSVRAPPATPPAAGRCGDGRWVSSDGPAGGLVSYHNSGRQGHGCPRETGNLSWICSAKVQGALYVRSSQYAARASATQWIDRPISPRLAVRPDGWIVCLTTATGARRLAFACY